MQLLNKEATINYLEQELKYDNTTAQIYQYKLNQTLVSVLYMLPAVIIAIVTSTIDLWLLALVSSKLVRHTIGGIHVKSNVACFILSFSIIEMSVWVPYFGLITVGLQRLLLAVDTLIWLLFVPRGTSQVPIVSETRKLKMKVYSGVTLLFLLGISNSSDLYAGTLILSASIMMLTVLPITYKIFKVSQFRDN